MSVFQKIVLQFSILYYGYNMPTKKSPTHSVMERIETIVYRLKSGETLSIKELSLEYDCDVKTIQRDMNQRIPELFMRLGIQAKLGKEGRRFKLIGDVNQFHNFEESLVLDVLQQLSTNISPSFALKANKLLSHASFTSSYLFTHLDFEDITHKKEEMNTLEEAIKQFVSISFTYKKELTKYEVHADPLKVICFDGFWYLLAKDHKDTIIKKYYFRAISNIKQEGESFSISKSLEDKLENAVNVWFNANSESFEVHLYADKEIVHYLMRRPISKSQHVVATDPDGSVEFSIMITDYNEIIPEVFKWIPYLFVLSPQALKEECEELLEEFLQQSKQISQQDI